MTKLAKFFPTTEEVQDIVLWVDDIEALVKEKGYAEALSDIMDRVIVGDLKCPGYVHVIDDNKDLAKTMAVALDQAYQKEMELMNETNTAKELVNEAIEAANAKKVVDAKVAEDKNAAARAFLEENGAAVANSKKSTKSTKKEEKEMESTKTTTRRRIAGARKSEETVVENNNNEKVENEVRKGSKKEEVEVKASGRQKLSGGRKGSAGDAVKKTTGRRKVKRGANLRSGGFEKHEGQWWSNVSLYPELEHVQSIVDSYDDETGFFTCPELDINTIVFVEPEDTRRYKNRNDIDVVIQIKSNGTVLEFPIKEASSNAKSPLTSSSIGWVEYNGKVRPAFGFWRPNAMEVEMECGCGTKFKANSGNVYCPKCKTRHDDVNLELEHETLEFAGEVQGWVFQEVPNLDVPKAFLAIVMALAHWDAGYDVEGLVEEDAE